MTSAVVSEIEEYRPVAAPPLLKPKRRHDSLPESTRYRDEGCDISESCLSCPLPRCRYEEPGGLRALLNEQRDRQIVQLRLKGVPVDALADHFGVSRRTVFRVIGSTKVTIRARTNGRPSGRLEAPAPIPIRRQIEVKKEAHCA
jgi:hypothetical protein